MTMHSFTGFSTLFVLVLAISGAAAQPSRPPGPPDSVRIEQTITEMRATVKLTDGQVAKIRVILTESSAALRRSQASGPVDRDAARQQMRATDEKIKALLTPEQIPAYERYREERREIMRKRMRDMQERPQ
jgi:Spy/CpxP family protein refolding chaperone